DGGEDSSLPDSPGGALSLSREDRPRLGRACFSVAVALGRRGAASGARRARCLAGPIGARRVPPLADDLVDCSILQSLLWRQEEVAVRVLRDALHRLARVLDQDLAQA